MKTQFITPILLMASLSAFGSNTMASDEFAGAVIGGGTGAVLGHVVGGRDGAFVGGFLGALIGAAAADDDDDRHQVARVPRTAINVSSPVRLYEVPRERYLQPVVVVLSPRQHPNNRWRFAQAERVDSWSDHGREDWRDNDKQRDTHRDTHRASGHAAHSSDDHYDRRGW
jgi:hypothetical protein